jgi:hypothetical protein
MAGGSRLCGLPLLSLVNEFGSQSLKKGDVTR